jgi:lipoyl-dependent peroxiredoxin
MAVSSKAKATWHGTLKGGKGEYAAGSGTFKGPYSFATRFEGAAGTTPEELLAAAHAACFSMALSADLEKAGTPAERIDTTAECTMDTVDGKPTVAVMKLMVKGKVPGVDQSAFEAAAKGARDNCPVSRALKAIPKVELQATLA